MSFTLRPFASGDDLANSRDPIRTNFSVIQSRFDENHVNIDGGAGGGKHSFLQMPEQGSAPTTAAAEGALYTQSAAGSNLFIRNNTDGSSYQLTTMIDASSANFGTAVFTTGNTDAAGWTFLPGGMILQYGTTDGLTTTGNTVITFPVAFPNACLSVTATMRRDTTGSVALGVNSAGTTTFRILNTSSTAGRLAYWMAIGN